jgi:knotted carbamoyltransferase YgeW
MTTTLSRTRKPRASAAPAARRPGGRSATAAATAARTPAARTPAARDSGRVTAALDALHGRSLLLTRDWSVPEIDALLAVARRFEQADRAGRSLALLPDQLAYALFFDNSTRTKSAWAGAATRLGMRPVIVDGGSTQVEHGETAAETGAMLGMNAHALGVRHDLILGEGQRFMRDVLRGITDYLAATGDTRTVPLVNLQCDVDHPTQTLADLMWLRERFPQGLAGRKIAVTWAYSPSYAKPLSVPQGLITLLTRFGAEVRLAHPEGYSLLDECVTAARRGAAESGGSFRVVQAMDEAFAGADAVYPKSWGPRELMLERVGANRMRDTARMREIEGRALEQNAGHRDWICDERRMGLTASGRALYMHCLPADIGAEVSPGVMKRAALDVARQANRKVYVVMALLAVAKVKDLARRLEGLPS